MNRLDVLVAGELYVDLILSGFDFWPQPGQEAYAKEFRRDIGGGAAITASGLATLGLMTGIFAVAGSDHHDWMGARLIERGVDTSELLVDPVEPTAFTVAISTPQERTFFTYTGSNRRFPRAVAQAARGGQLARARHAHLAYAPSWDVAEELFENIHENGCTLSLDAGWHEDWLTDRRAPSLLPLVDVFFPNEMEAARMTGAHDPEEMLHRFAQAGLRCVALKLGARGSAALCGEEFVYAPPINVEPVDTTGAGDCFNAGFLYGWLNDQPIETCLRIGNVCGGLSTEEYGGIAGFPGPARLRRELERG
jgi:sugar/nucleoside kinase (ribokinase family)